MGVSNNPLQGARLDGLLNLSFGGSREFFVDCINHADYFLVLAQINAWHILAYPYISFEENFLALWGGYNPVSLYMSGDNVTCLFKHGDGK